MQQFLDGLPEGGLIMCHPGFVDETLVSLDPLTDQREHEQAFLAGEHFPASVGCEQSYIEVTSIKKMRPGRVVACLNLIRDSTTGGANHPYIFLALRSERGRESMTPQERQLIDDLFDRLSKLENAPARSRRRRGYRGRFAQGAQRRLRAGADRPGPGRSAQARQQPHPGTGGRRRRRTASIRRVSSIRCAKRSSGRASHAARYRTSGRPICRTARQEQRPGASARAAAGAI